MAPKLILELGGRSTKLSSPDRQRDNQTVYPPQALLVRLTPKIARAQSGRFYRSWHPPVSSPRTISRAGDKLDFIASP